MFNYAKREETKKKRMQVVLERAKKRFLRGQCRSFGSRCEWVEPIFGVLLNWNPSLRNSGVLPLLKEKYKWSPPLVKEVSFDRNDGGFHDRNGFLLLLTSHLQNNPSLCGCDGLNNLPF